MKKINKVVMRNELIEILCCPECKADLKLIDNRLISTNPECRRAYRVEDNIPIMLVDEAEILSIDEWEKIMK